MERRINLTLSVLIPVYNEEKYLLNILEKLLTVRLPGRMEMELIIINDFSQDRSEEVILNFIKKYPYVHVKYLKHDRNYGKGMAIRTGIKEITGSYAVIQDADLEYDPNDFLEMLPYLFSGKYRVVYGSRFLNRQNKHSYQSFYWGGRLVSFVTNLLYFQHLTDEPTCYKMFDSQLLKSIPLNCTGFEFCPEVTAKISKRKFKIKEVPIHYYPRSVEEGKKIKWYDGVNAIWTLLKYRFSN